MHCRGFGVFIVVVMKPSREEQDPGMNSISPGPGLRSECLLSLDPALQPSLIVASTPGRYWPHKEEKIWVLSIEPSFCRNVH